ncbi:MAG: hypothetical protein ACOCPM_06365 [Bacteroidales bacterium]
MKILSNIITTTMILIVITSMLGCRTSTLYSDELNTKNFSCEDKHQINKQDIIKIHPQDVKDCFLSDTNKITWIIFYYNDCTKDIAREVAIYKEYQERLNFLIISTTYDIADVLRESHEINYPIYFISKEVKCDCMRRNLRAFTDSLFNNNPASKDAGKYMNLFIDKNEIIYLADSVNRDLISEIMNNAKN